MCRCQLTLQEQNRNKNRMTPISSKVYSRERPFRGHNPCVSLSSQVATHPRTNALWSVVAARAPDGDHTVLTIASVNNRGPRSYSDPDPTGHKISSAKTVGRLRDLVDDCAAVPA
jgi:hypothetical protein